MAANKFANLSDAELLAGTTEDKLNRVLLLLRDGFKDINDKVAKHIQNTEEKFDAIELKWENKYKALLKRFDELENKQDNEQVLSEYHNKKYNMIIHKLPEEESHWETNIESIDKVRAFFRDDLGVYKADEMRFVNAHRMGLRKTIVDTDTGEKLHTRPLIVRFSCMPDKERVQKKLTELRAYNRNIAYKHRVFVTDQLPQRMDAQRKLLVEQFKRARKRKVKAKWSVDKYGNYCLYVNNEQVFPESSE